MREASPKDKKAETVWEVATKEAVEGAPHQSGAVHDSQASEGGGRFTERHRIPAKPRSRNSRRALRPMRIAILVGRNEIPFGDEVGRRPHYLHRLSRLPVESIAG